MLTSLIILIMLLLASVVFSSVYFLAELLAVFYNLKIVGDIHEIDISILVTRYVIFKSWSHLGM
jgi:hypothetical protein